jgi:hypothetical protein
MVDFIDLGTVQVECKGRPASVAHLCEPSRILCEWDGSRGQTSVMVALGKTR